MDDLISRSDALNTIKAFHCEYETSMEVLRLNSIELAIEHIPSEILRECDGCRYEELDPKEFPCYECRRNYFDKFEEDDDAIR